MCLAMVSFGQNQGPVPTLAPPLEKTVVPDPITQPEPDSYSDAIEIAKEEKKPLIIMFTAQWCQPCQDFKRRTLFPIHNKLRQTHIIYMVDVDNKREARTKQAFRSLPKGWQWTGQVPTVYVTDTQVIRLRSKTVGYMSPQTFEQWLIIK
jgi:thiol:disulfide interchange protein